MELPIYLIGYMAAGKTTVGKMVAERLGWHFVDLDDAFLEVHGISTGDFIRQHGIDTFRIVEKSCVEKLAELPIQKVIYATGGGYPCWQDNMDCLLELGTTFYLRWTPEQLTERLFLSGLENRPLATQGMQAAAGADDREKMLHFVSNHLAERDPIYSRAHYVLQADPGLDALQDEKLADQIVDLITR